MSAHPGSVSNLQKMTEFYELFSFLRWDTETRMSIIMAKIVIFIIGCVVFGLLSWLGLRIKNKHEQLLPNIPTLGVITLIIIF